MTKKIILLLPLLAGMAVSGCSTVNSVVPDRFQVWADDGTDGTSPNLSDMPNEEAILEARESADSLRAQLEADRERARRAAMGLPVESPDDGGSYFADETTTPSHVKDITESQSSMWQRLSAVNSGDDTSYYYPDTVQTPSMREPAPTDYYMPDNIIVNYDAIPDPDYIRPNNPVSYDNDVQYQYLNNSTGYTSAKKKLSNGQAYLGGSFLGHGSYVYASNNAPEEIAPAETIRPGLAGMVFFDYGSSQLGSADKQFLGDMAGQLSGSFSPLRIIGHADSKTQSDDPVKSTQINLTMSLKRATAVLKELHAQGVPYTQMSVFAYGDSQPLWDVDGKTKEEAARRVEIYVDEE